MDKLITASEARQLLKPGTRYVVDPMDFVMREVHKAAVTKTSCLVKLNVNLHDLEVVVSALEIRGYRVSCDIATKFKGKHFRHVIVDWSQGES